MNIGKRIKPSHNLRRAILFSTVLLSTVSGGCRENTRQIISDSLSSSKPEAKIVFCDVGESKAKTPADKLHYEKKNQVVNDATFYVNRASLKMLPN